MTLREAIHLVGVTGGIGCGKSEVCRILSSLGCKVFNADNVAKQIQEEDADVIAGMKKLFGDDIYHKNGTARLLPDRKKIAQIVFSDEKKLQALNNLIHPKVFAAFERAKESVCETEKKVLVKEAAILFEAGGTKGLDEIVVVAADFDVRLERLKQAGMEESQIRSRMQSQWSQEELIKRADFVIYNNSSLESLKAQTESVLEKILA
ncbi:dephospho-CoA kinase [Chloroherpeton thalassium ATCC 35110]|uniref:Dephospho-CoA kinase n=1 Tax=Chloroherpeton thalassium (strain ATCC 35110 / GB-78) TaxID=517418 RepID=B3QX15_CHLT3|nr:dephospho-CoA kinase [Chloroherpeton thalassium]ACF14825.1 dephospho-CoA kinase [Chloroherpeton thalassium ATCC 35110]